MRLGSSGLVFGVQVSALTDQEIEQIAQRILAQIHEERHNFAVPPEQHYNAHRSIDELLADWRLAKSIFWKAFIGLAVLGGIILSTLGLSGWHR
jgi:hypothetical protein